MNTILGILMDRCTVGNRGRIEVSKVRHGVWRYWLFLGGDVIFVDDTTSGSTAVVAVTGGSAYLAKMIAEQLGCDRWYDMVENEVMI